MDKPKRKKPNRQARMEKKAREADIFNKGFLMGYQTKEDEIRKAMIRQTINKNHEALRGLRD